MHKMPTKKNKKLNMTVVSKMDWAILSSQMLVMFMLLPLLFASMLLTVMATMLRWPIKYTMNDMFASHDKRTEKKIKELDRMAKSIERRRKNK